MAAVNLGRMQQKFLKKFGKHAMIAASDTKALSHIPYGISAQSLMLDLAIGRPGFPAGRMTEIVAKTNQGKSTLAYHAMAQCQRQGGFAMLFETEFAYEAWRLQDLGVDTEALRVVQPHNVEELYAEMAMAIREVRAVQKFKGPVLFVVDTIANLPSVVEEQGNYYEKFMAVAARAHALGLRKFVWTLAEHKIVLVYLNQLTNTLVQYGDQLTSYGGSAIHKNASARAQLTSRKQDQIRVGGELVSAWTNVSMLKNKLESPFDKAKYLLNFKTGIDIVEDLWQAGRQLRVITPTQKGAKFALGEKSVLLTREKFEQFVMEKFKSPAALRERLTKVAVEQQLLRPYGE